MYDVKIRLNVTRRDTMKIYSIWLLVVLLLMLLMGCDSEKDRRDKYQATVNPENGKIVEVNGEKFRIVYIGGVRFRFPITFGLGWTGVYANKPETESVGIGLYWPDIPPGKAPGTERSRNNSVSVLVMGKKEPVKIDKSVTIEQKNRLNPADYIVRDDMKLGLRTFSPKEFPNFRSYAYSLTEDAVTPWGHEPVMISSEYIYFIYAPQIEVRIEMWREKEDIDPNWKGIYLGVVETLDKYREDKP
jgi:hypothetical protein